MVISVRNFIRAFGGSCGLAISAAVLSNVLQSKIPAGVPSDIRSAIRKSIYRVPDLSHLSADQRNGILDAYFAGSRAVFIFMVPLMSICLVLCFLIKDNGLQRKEEIEVVVAVANQSVGSSVSEVTTTTTITTPIEKEKDIESTKRG